MKVTPSATSYESSSLKTTLLMHQTHIYKDFRLVLELNLRVITLCSKAHVVVECFNGQRLVDGINRL